MHQLYRKIVRRDSKLTHDKVIIFGREVHRDSVVHTSLGRRDVLGDVSNPFGAPERRGLVQVDPADVFGILVDVRRVPE
jgi:hypothetical protein